MTKLNKKFIAIELVIPETVINNKSGQPELDYIEQIVKLLKKMKNSDGNPFRMFYDDPDNPNGIMRSATLDEIVTGNWEFIDEPKGY